MVHRFAEEVPDPPAATPSRVVVDETAIMIDTDQHQRYAAIEIETKLRWAFPFHGTVELIKPLCFSVSWPRNLSETTFLIDDMGYLTALA